MATAPLPRMSLEQYLELEERSERLHEFHDGEVYEMESATFRHQQIGTQFLGGVRPALKARGCEIHCTGTIVSAAPTVMPGQAAAPGRSDLRCNVAINASSNAPPPKPSQRSVKGGTAASTILIAGQFRPQANASSSGVSARRIWACSCSRRGPTAHHGRWRVERASFFHGSSAGSAAIGPAALATSTWLACG